MITTIEETTLPGVAETGVEASVGMGLSALAAAPDRLTAILGSCVGVTVYCPALRLGMLSHVLLPDSRGRSGHPAKFADSAVRHMCSTLAARGAKPDELLAKIAGGARMFGRGVHTRIGEENVRAAVAALDSAGVRIVAREVGGDIGRRISFDLSTGSVTVESIGRESRTM
ncbi:MAG: chemotaxis protein CheD [Pirellulales bacterium]|nr:chemotaxis protein CheD [Pirellulales bacterium]